MADVIVVAGLPGAGKTTLARLIERMGYSYYSLGDVVRLEAQRRGYTPDKAAVTLRVERGKRAVVNILLENIKPGGRVVIDGVRSLEEVEAIEERLGPAFLIYVVASRKTRFQRLAARGRGDDPSAYSQFLLRDLRELRFGLANLLARSDYIIVNEKPIEELERELRSVL